MIYPLTAPFSGYPPNREYRYGGSTTPEEGDPVMVLSTGRRVAGLPMNGFKVESWSASQFYPFLLPLELDANPAGGLGIVWWWKVKAFRARVRYRARHRDFPLVVVEFDQLLNLTRVASPGLNDERDLVNPSAYFWFGTGNTGEPNTPGATVVSGRLELFGPPRVPQGSSVAMPYSWLACEESLVPGFHLRFSLSQYGTAFSSLVCSYQFTAETRSIQFGTGAMDGMAFQTFTQQGDVSFPYIVEFMAVTVTRLHHFDHGGVWNQGTGGYAPGQTTNRFRDR